jgi:hypothetical protein
MTQSVQHWLQAAIAAVLLCNACHKQLAAPWQLPQLVRRNTILYNRCSLRAHGVTESDLCTAVYKHLSPAERLSRRITVYRLKVAQCTYGHMTMA